MKKTILFFGLAAGIFTANAQTSTDPVEVKVNFKHSQTIAVNHSSIVLEYVDSEDYKDGVSVQKDDHLSVFSTGGYTINVAANSTDSSILSDGTPTAIKILASLGTSDAKNNKLTFTPAAELSLKTTTQPLGSSTNAGKGNISVTYKGANDDLYVDQLGGKDTTLTTNVIYTIAVD